MAVKNILFKIGADASAFNAQLDAIGKRIDDLKKSTAELGKSLSTTKGSTALSDQQKLEKQLTEFEKNAARERSKNIIKEQENLLKEIDKAEKQKRDKVKKTADQAIENKKREVDQQSKLINTLTRQLIAAEEQAEKKRESDRRKRVESEKKAAEQITADRKKELDKSISDLAKFFKKAQAIEDKRKADEKKALSDVANYAQRKNEQELKRLKSYVAQEAKAKADAEKEATKTAEREAAKRKKIADQEAKNAQRLAAQSKAQFQNIVKGGLAIIGIQSAVQALKDFTLEAVRSAAEFQKNQIAFKTFLGSAVQANDILKQLTDLAIRTPFTSEQTIQAARVLAAYGFNAAELLPIIERLGNISSGTSIPLEQIALVFGQIKAAGKLMGQDLLQLVNAGFNPLQEISERTGESMASLRKRMGEGKIAFREVAESMTFATEKGGRFYNLNQKLAETTAGKLDALKEQWQLFTRETGTAIEPLTAKVIDLTKALIELGNQLKITFVPTVTFLGGNAIKGVQEVIDSVNYLIKIGREGIDIPIRFAFKTTAKLARGGEVPKEVMDEIDKYSLFAKQEIASKAPSVFIPKKEEQLQLKDIKEKNDALRKQIDLLKTSYTEDLSKGTFTYDVKAIDALDALLGEGEKIDRKKLTASRNYRAELERVYLAIAKNNEIESKNVMYENISKAAGVAIQRLEALKKSQPILNANGAIDAEIERLKQLQYDSEARIVIKTIEEGKNLDRNKDKLEGIVDLYKRLRELAAQIEDLRVEEFKGEDEATQRYKAERRNAIELQRIEELKAKRVKELSDQKLSAIRKADKEAVLSAEQTNEILKIVDFELFDERRIAENKYNEEILAIDTKFNQQREEANSRAYQRLLEQEEDYFNDSIEENKKYIQKLEGEVQQATRKKKFRAAIEALRGAVGFENTRIRSAAMNQINQLNIEEDATALRENQAGASADTLKQIEEDYAAERERINAEANKKIQENNANLTGFIKTEEQVRRDAILDGWSTLVGEIANLGQQLTDALIMQTERQIEAQEKRVDKAREIADKGNAQILELEQERLDKLNKKRQDAARIAIAIAKTEAIAQASLAVAKAAALTGPGAPLAIASTITALIAGIASAAVAISNSGGFEKGGYTGDGGRKEPAGTVHKGEFVFTQEKTKKYRTLFEEIHKGRDPFVAMNYNDKVVVINNNSMNDRLERIEKAIMGQNRMQLHIDEKGIYGIVSEIQYKQDRLRSRF